jgi:photosynthetic reaction center H subunit
MSSELTPYLDVTQVVLYAFWLFFAELIYWLRKEDRREGYPVESDSPRIVLSPHSILIPKPKTFLLPNGHTVQAPRFDRDERELKGERTARSAGSPMEPIGDGLLSGMGAAAWAERADEHELTLDGADMIVPLRAAPDFEISAGPDPRGFDVVAADGELAGTVQDLWVDRADVMVRYLEVALGTTEGAVSTSRLLPIGVLTLERTARRVRVSALRAEQFSAVPALKQPDRITLLEEERISAFYAGGRRYAEPKRTEPLL